MRVCGVRPAASVRLIWRGLIVELNVGNQRGGGLVVGGLVAGGRSSEAGTTSKAIGRPAKVQMLPITSTERGRYADPGAHDWEIPVPTGQWPKSSVGDPTAQVTGGVRATRGSQREASADRDRRCRLSPEKQAVYGNRPAHRPKHEIGSQPRCVHPSAPTLGDGRDADHAATWQQRIAATAVIRKTGA